MEKKTALLDTRTVIIVVFPILSIHEDPTDIRESTPVFQISTINRSKLDKRRVRGSIFGGSEGENNVL